MKDLTGQAPRYLKDRILGLRLRALSDKTGYAASGGELTSREIKYELLPFLTCCGE